jgi:hypothetical protein
MASAFLHCCSNSSGNASSNTGVIFSSNELSKYFLKLSKLFSQSSLGYAKKHIKIFGESPKPFTNSVKNSAIFSGLPRIPPELTKYFVMIQALT